MTATELVALLKAANLKVATAESCTGGMVAAALTDIPGSSDVFECGFVTYSNAAKAQLLGVPATLIAQHGAVSAEVAIAMANGALVHCEADIAVAISGVAGPSGGTPAKPVGLVYFACARRGFAPVHLAMKYGDIGRDNVRKASVATALELVAKAI